MNEELIKIMYEMLQNVAYASKLLVTSEIAMNDGEIEISQKNTKEAQSFIKVLMNDTFEEFEEESEVENDEVNDYDIPTSLELTRQLISLEYDTAMLLGLYQDKQTELYGNAKKKILKDINTVAEIYTAIFDN